MVLRGVASGIIGFADLLQVLKHIKALQQSQKELGEAISNIRERMREIEMEMRAHKAETRHEALKEAQAIVNAVQGSFNDRLNDLAIRVGLASRGPGGERQAPDFSSPFLGAPGDEA